MSVVPPRIPDTCDNCGGRVKRVSANGTTAVLKCGDCGNFVAEISLHASD